MSKKIPTIEEVIDYVGQLMPGVCLGIAGVYDARIDPTTRGKLCTVTDRRTGQSLVRLYQIKGGRWQHFTEEQQRDQDEMLNRRWRQRHPIRSLFGMQPSERDMDWLRFELGSEEREAGEWGDMRLGGGLLG